MPISSQALYFHLGLNADDDGIVEAYNVISSINGCTEDDLKVLVSKGFIQVLNEDLVTYITDWTENNKIRADRKIDSIYKDLLISVNPTVQLLEKRPRADIKPKIVNMDDQWTSNGQPMDRIGKDRIGKDSLGKVRIGKAKKDGLKALVDGVSDPELKEALNDFIKMRKEIKKPLTERALKIVLNKLDGLASDPHTQSLILLQSVEHCWQTVYELKTEQKTKSIIDEWENA
jgi:hypothetical protein